MKKRMLSGLWAASLVSVSILFGACGGKADTPQVAASASSAASEASSAASAATAAAPVARDYIIIGVDDDSTPMSFWDPKTNIISGYDIDMAKEAFKRAGLKYEFQPIVWADKEDSLLKDKKIDVIWSSLTITDARKKIFAFSTPYIKNRQSILVRADSPIQSKADLGGKRVVLNKGGVAVDLVKQMSGANAPAKIDELEKKVDLFSAVLSGQADAAINDSLAMEYYSSSSPGKFRILKDSLQEEEFGVAVRPSDTELLAKINKALADMQADGTAQAIYQRWFGVSQ